ICMDMCMVDVTDIPNVQVGDIATVYGRDGDERLPVEEAADIVGTIQYELLCAISERVPRVYLDR
ncbi:MAG: alanine racemase C-terminal domain-containing protein, partial [Pseudoflavonifractor sp.]